MSFISITYSIKWSNWNLPQYLSTLSSPSVLDSISRLQNCNWNNSRLSVQNFASVCVRACLWLRIRNTFKFYFYYYHCLNIEGGQCTHAKKYQCTKICEPVIVFFSLPAHVLHFSASACTNCNVHTSHNHLYPKETFRNIVQKQWKVTTLIQ